MLPQSSLETRKSHWFPGDGGKKNITLLERPWGKESGPPVGGESVPSWHTVLL